MPKMSTDLKRVALNGAVMGTRWSAVFYAPETQPLDPIHAALSQAVETVDRQMSIWKPDSDLMRLNAAEVGVWHAAPPELLAVLQLGLAIGQASGGAFDVGLGDVVQAWGFGPDAADPARIIAAMKVPHRPSHEVLQIDAEAGKLRKTAALTLDLNGIAKGYAVDRMTDVLTGFGITTSLTSLDGELRGKGVQPDGSAWPVAVEKPDYTARSALAMLDLHDAAVATSGDYRHWVDVGAKRLSHTIDRQRAAPVEGGAASVTVMAASCAEADAWATALLVLGPEAGLKLAQRQGLSALFLTRQGDDFLPQGCGVFA